MGVEGTQPTAPQPTERARVAASRRARTAAKPATPSGAGTPSKDGVDVSDEARFLARMDDAAAEAAGDRSELIDHLKQQVDSGAYVLDAESLAETLIEQDEA